MTPAWWPESSPRSKAAAVSGSPGSRLASWTWACAELMLSWWLSHVLVARAIVGYVVLLGGPVQCIDGRGDSGIDPVPMGERDIQKVVSSSTSRGPPAGPLHRSPFANATMFG
jgi:hypothetical protein